MPRSRPRERRFPSGAIPPSRQTPICRWPARRRCSPQTRLHRGQANIWKKQRFTVQTNFCQFYFDQIFWLFEKKKVEFPNTVSCLKFIHEQLWKVTKDSVNETNLLIFNVQSKQILAKNLKIRNEWEIFSSMSGGFRKKVFYFV